MIRDGSLYDAASAGSAVRPPPGSWDCLFHAFGDPERYPLRSGPRAEPPENATIEDAAALHRAAGLERGVIVQSALDEISAGRRRLVDVLRARPAYRGAALIDSSVSDRELATLHEAGVRGVRFNFVPWAPMPEGPVAFRRLLERIAEFDWYAHIHSVPALWPELSGYLAEIKVRAVIDHMGQIRPDDPAAAEAERIVSSLLERENWWIMIANADRLSSRTAPGVAGWADVLPLARRLIAAAPDRAVWATDWPHVSYHRPDGPASDDLLGFLYAAAPDAAARQKILVDNPPRLLNV